MRERQIESLFDNYPCPLLQNKNRYENYYNCLNRTAFSIIYAC